MNLGIISGVPQSHLFGLKASMVLRGEGNSLAMAATGNVAQASTAAAPDNVLEWVKKDKRRLLHVVYRVGDLDRTIKYVVVLYYMKFHIYCLWIEYFG